MNRPTIKVYLKQIRFQENVKSLFQRIGTGYVERNKESLSFWIGNERFDFMSVDTEYKTLMIEKYDADRNRSAHEVYDNANYEMEPFVEWIAKFI